MQDLKLEQHPLILQVVRQHLSCQLANDRYVFCNLITTYINLAASLQAAPQPRGRAVPGTRLRQAGGPELPTATGGRESQDGSLPRLWGARHPADTPTKLCGADAKARKPPAASPMATSPRPAWVIWSGPRHPPHPPTWSRLHSALRSPALTAGKMAAPEAAWNRLDVPWPASSATVALAAQHPAGPRRWRRAGLGAARARGALGGVRGRSRAPCAALVGAGRPRVVGL